MHELSRSYGTPRGEELFTKDNELLGIFKDPATATQYSKYRSDPEQNPLPENPGGLSAYQSYRQGERDAYPKNQKSFTDSIRAWAENQFGPTASKELAKLAELWQSTKLSRILDLNIPSDDSRVPPVRILDRYLPWLMEQRRREMKIKPPPEPQPGNSYGLWPFWNKPMPNYQYPKPNPGEPIDI